MKCILFLPTDTHTYIYIHGHTHSETNHVHFPEPTQTFIHGLSGLDGVNDTVTVKAAGINF